VCRFCKLRMLYMFKTFVSLLPGHASYKIDLKGKAVIVFFDRQLA